MGTQKEIHGSSHTFKSRMGTRGCRRGYTPETGNETWRNDPWSPGSSNTPVSSARTQVLTSHSVDLDNHNCSLGSTSGTPPWLAFPRTALPSFVICIACHCTPPQPKAQPLQGFSLPCAHLWAAEALSPVPSSWRSHIPHVNRFTFALVYPTFSSWHANHYHLFLVLPLWVQKSLKAFLFFFNSPGQAGSDLDQPRLCGKDFRPMWVSWTSSASLTFS